jgi:hypothetical protein
MKRDILKMVVDGTTTHTLEMRGNNCFLIKRNDKTDEIFTTKDKAEKAFKKIEDAFENAKAAREKAEEERKKAQEALKGGEKQMVEETKNVTTEDENVEATLAKVQEQAIAMTNEMAQMYAESAKVGASNLSGEMPLLKVHAAGKSKNELADGTKPNDGWFFYKPTQEQFETIDCHILTISRGFRAPDMNGQPAFNQIIAGIIIDGMKPFIMYVNRKKLKQMWDFGKAAARYTRAKPVPIPMFALTVRLKTHSVPNDFGDSWLIDFEILKNPDTKPVLVMDPGEFQFLKDSVEDFEDTIESLISTKTKEEVVEGNPQPLEATDVEPTVDTATADGSIEVDPEDIPF